MFCKSPAEKINQVLSAFTQAKNDLHDLLISMSVERQGLMEKVSNLDAAYEKGQKALVQLEKLTGEDNA